MKGIYSRLNGYTITNKTLKMNNYIDSKFFDGYNTFFPKKSFNKIINILIEIKLKKIILIIIVNLKIWQNILIKLVIFINLIMII